MVTELQCPHIRYIVETLVIVKVTVIELGPSYNNFIFGMNRRQFETHFTIGNMQNGLRKC